MDAIGDSIDKYDIIRERLLGEGAFGQVYRAKVRESDMEVAIKMIDKNKIKDASIANQVDRELSIHSRLKHSSVVELYTFFKDEQKVYLVLELCQESLQSSLDSRMMNKKGPFLEGDARKILGQVVRGLIYLHKDYIIHRDLNLANLLWAWDRKVKIGDFGVAIKLSSPNETSKTFCGTPNYISPEIAVQDSHGLETDLWSLGIVLYTLLVGKPPFDSDNWKMILEKVVKGEVEFPEHLSSDSIDLMKLLLKKDPKERIRLNEILQRPFLAKVSNPSINLENHDSGVATSNTVSSTLQTKSCNENDRVLDGSVALAPLLLPPLLPNPMSLNSHHFVQKPSGFHHGASASSHHTGSVPLKSAKSNRHGEMPRSGVLHGSSSFPHSAEIPTFEPPSRRFHSASNPPSTSNCSHAWKQCGCGHGNIQCFHVKTCSCMRSNGCNSSCARSTSNYKSCINTNQQQEPAYMPSRPSLEKKPPSVTNWKLVPLNTTRLKPIRQKKTSKRNNLHTIYSILENGEVCLELIKPNEPETVIEVFRVSADGRMIQTYFPNQGKGVPPSNIPPPVPLEGAHRTYFVPNVPKKVKNLYYYAYTFVDLVKAQTPKVIGYTGTAKCMLMENGDFQVHFYDGPKFSKSGSQVITDVSSNGIEMSLPLKIKWKHFQRCLKQCQIRERLLMVEEIAEGFKTTIEPGIAFFPVRFGNRPNRKANTPTTKKPSSEVSRTGTNR